MLEELQVFCIAFFDLPLDYSIHKGLRADETNEIHQNFIALGFRDIRRLVLYLPSLFRVQVGRAEKRQLAQVKICRSQTCFLNLP